MMNKTKIDCFAFNNGKCLVLKKLYCQNEKCKFYKTFEKFQADANRYGFKLKGRG